MTTPFADRFAAAESSSIVVDGEAIHAMVEVPVEGPATIVVARVQARTDRPQGLVIDAGSRTLRVGVARSSRFTLWSDTAPEMVALSLAERGPCTLKLWNTWRDDLAEHAWVGWAAIKSDDRDGVVRLRCRDGHDDGSFDDLVVDVRP